MAAQRPAYTWEQYKAANPTTAYDHLSYCAGQFSRREAGKAERPGEVFKWDGTPWRVVKITANPFNPVLAVPACWPERYWEAPTHG